MSELRLILLIAGVLAVASLYVWETLKGRRTGKSGRRPNRGLDVPEIRPSPEQQAPADYLQTLAELPSLAGNDLDSAAQAGVERLDPAGGEPMTAGARGEEVIALHVRALPGSCFHGEDIVRAAGKAGMRHGSMNIFHYRSVRSDRTSETLFSLSNMFEPGTLAPDQMRNFQTSGVTLFMCLLPFRDNALIFERMLSAARQLADELHGQVCGPGRRDMNDDRLSELRAKAAAYR